MIEYLKGELTQLKATQVVIECGGIGYCAEISLATHSLLQPSAGDDSTVVRLLIHEVIREDEHLLYGFVDAAERDMFRLLISVSGVGPNTARLMLSTLSVGELAAAISADDVRTVQHVKGVGAKTAQRVIVELKDKMKSFGAVGTSRQVATDSVSKNEALQALTMLGFAKAATEKALASLDASLSTEELIKAALPKLS